MYIRKHEECEEFIARDNSVLRELLHPAKADIELRYSLAHATVPPGEETLPHALKTTEVYYIIRGEGIMYIGDEREEVGPGQAIYIPPRAKQHIHNTGKTPLVFLCIVDPAWRVEDEHVI
jgi:mannose-6-phosphate isomerase-like protein (cupin superfamily)